MWKLMERGVKQQTQVILTRWTLLIGAAYLVLFGTGAKLQQWQQLVFVAMLLANLGLYSVVVRRGAWAKFRWVITLSDITFVTTAVALAGRASNDFFLFFFLVLMVAGISSRFGLTVLATSFVCGVYITLLYWQIGSILWRHTDFLIRVPFLFGVGLFFGSLSVEARREENRLHHLSHVTRKMVHRYHQVASERDRTRALLEISQLALTPIDPSTVLQSITAKVRETVRVDRCSLVVFNHGERHAYLAASSDDHLDVVLLLSLSHYPELRSILETGEITELHADASGPVWDKVRKHLPKPDQFRSSLVVPILQQETVAGAFFLRDARPDFTFHDEEKVFCEAAAMMTASYLQGRDLVEEMRRRSRLDGLTGLLNFPTFRHELDRELSRVPGHGEDLAPVAKPRPLCLVMVDVDNLKVINDHYGHLVGNQVIQEVGRLLARAVPNALSICRYGGDEFFALVPLDKAQTAQRAERLLIGLEQLDGRDVPCTVSVSIGVAGTPEDGEDADTLLEAADRAMYLAKGQGGHRIHVADADDDTRGQLYQAIIAVNARRLLPGEGAAFRQVLDQLLRLEEKELDSTVIRQSLTALMEAVHSKDRYTESHSHEVSDLTRELAMAVGLEDRQILAVEMAALVHDIGKIGIPDEILNKPGPLTTRERMQIERHPEIGAQILSPLPALHDVVPLVLHHHERWDGGGYPHGLKGEQIPLGAQIISLCDVWHALTTDRAYRKAYTCGEAKRIIAKGRGTEWGPRLVDRFFEILDRLQPESVESQERLVTPDAA